jgi:hypothetical protein
LYLDMIKTLTGDPSFGTNRGDEGTFPACFHQYDIEAGVSLLVGSIGKKRRNALGLQRLTC